MRLPFLDLPLRLPLLIASSLCLPSGLMTLFAADAAPQNTVFWISVDGFAADYLERAKTPFLDRLQAEGAWSRAAMPIFPSITFPNHCSIATGTYPEQHGITGNSFYDRQDKKVYNFPNQASMLQSEPIWITAARQGAPSIVYDWPLSQNQKEEPKSRYFAEFFDMKLSTTERFDRALDAWEADVQKSDIPAPRLIMTYTPSPDVEGHNFGPDAEETIAAVEKVDQELSAAYDRAVTIWEKSKRGAEDQLFFVISSDHGMAKINTLVNPERLIAIARKAPTQVVTTGNVGHVFLDPAFSDSERAKEFSRIFKRLEKFSFVQAWKYEEIPEKWQLQHPTRTGDILLVLDKGYNFNRRAKNVYSKHDGTVSPRGMHGYDPEKVPEMKSPLFLFRYPNKLGSHDLGEVKTIHLHTTVAKILGVEPAKNATKESILWQKK